MAVLPLVLKLDLEVTHDHERHRGGDGHARQHWVGGRGWFCVTPKNHFFTKKLYGATVDEGVKTAIIAQPAGPPAGLIS